MQRSGSYGDELPPGARLCGGQYTIERYLNSGGFGVTYLARDSLGRSVVIKECFPSAMCCRVDETVRLRSSGNETEFGAILELFEKEARALAALQHPYIVGVHQYFRDNGTAYMAMDFVDGKTLLDVIENDPDRLAPEDVKALLIQILEALSYIHGHDILHRDISPDNILIDADNLPVLIDFGAARESATRVSRVLSKVLTVKDGYSPQEFYLAGSDHAYSSDLYALAATFYHVVSRTAPPSSHSRLAATAREKRDPLDPLGEIDGYDPYFLDAINRCLSVFPKDRLQSAAAWRDMIDEARRQERLLQQADEDEELERRVAELVREFEREWEERERRQREVLEAQHQMTDEERAAMEAEARARAEEEERARADAAAQAQREAEEVQAAIAAERAAQSARRAAIEAEEARQFHEAMKALSRPLLEEFDEIDGVGRSAAAETGTNPKESAATQAVSSVLPRRVQVAPQAANGGASPAPRHGPVRRALFGGRRSLTFDAKGSKP
ncbi:serine/threonine protein kinase [Roseibacterium sp. SDUM158016]|jgi:serine/threonine protein kinase|uniref:serine/threonine-protein kinase n=1 Tax=Roseicyclus sediminis TaxID=2980997 RepID=UPI0021D172D5|nr:serine/threonine-protein kinase [Roseibacterium sp. SDUM158016]MCU4652774.1 serine/threonine protein kinase [Roseibacterium sp. SDUM158016]